MPDNNNDKTGNMLLNVVASVAVAAGVSPEKAAKAFTSDKDGKQNKWLVDFTMACMKEQIANMAKDKKVK